MILSVLSIVAFRPWVWCRHVGSSQADARSIDAGSGLPLRGRGAPLVLFAAYVLLSVAWIMANPPGASPDEVQHYVKALGTASLDPFGRTLAHDDGPDSPETLRWFRLNQRAWDIPSRFWSSHLNCSEGKATEPASCLDAPGGTPPAPTVTLETEVGTYQPYLYVLPGLLGRTAGGPFAAIRLARVGFGLVNLVLLGLAIACLWDSGGRGLSVVGLVLALTPMVVFMLSSANPNGSEIAGASCFLAALIRLGRGSHPPARVWLALGLGGTVLAVSRTPGPAVVIMGAVFFLAAFGTARLRDLVRVSRRHAVLAGSSIVMGCVASVGWALLAQPQAPRNAGRFLHELGPSIDELPLKLREAIGIFGSLDSPMPHLAYQVWMVMLVGLVLLALSLGSWRQRAVLAGAVVATIGYALVLSAGVLRQVGFGLQGRYVLPIAVVVPLYAGEVLLRWANWSRWLTAASVGATTAGAATVHLVAWYFHGRRESVGYQGPGLWLSHALWRPPWGWGPWLVVAVVAALGLVSAGLLATPAIATRRVEATSCPQGSSPTRADARPRSRGGKRPGRS